jgi:predicted transcriptional regulator
MLKALKKTITRPDRSSISEIESEKEPICILMNQKRQQILQLIFKYPCKHLHEIARNFGFSINTTRWHLRKLLNFGYIEEHELGNRKVYFPNYSLQEKDIKILGLLNNKKFEVLFTEILHFPGITQKEIYERLNEKQSTIVDRLVCLEEHKLIYSQKDGLYRRYYPTSIIKSLEKESRRILKKYRKSLIQILEYDGVEPTILRTTDKKFHIRIKSGKSKADLIFYFNPYDRFLA